MDLCGRRARPSFLPPATTSAGVLSSGHPVSPTVGPSSLARAPGRRSCGCSWAEIARLHAGVELARPRATRPLACGG